MAAAVTGQAPKMRHVPRARRSRRVRAGVLAILAALLSACTSAVGVSSPAAPASAAATASPAATASAGALASAGPPTSAETPASPAATSSAGGDCLGPAGAGAFIRTDGARFLCGSQPIAFSGFTMYPSAVGGSSAWHRADFPGYIDRMLDLGAQAGLNLVRPTDEWDKHATGQSWTDPVVWRNLDYLVAAARRRGMHVVMDISAFRWLLASQGRDPFDSGAWRAFVAFVTARYAGETGVAFYSIVGEPDPPHTTADMDRLTAFYSSVLDMVHAGDPNHLVTLGALNHMEDESAAVPWWHRLYSLPGNDIVAFKTYSQHDLDLMPVIATYARQIHKPLFEGEFGMPQSAGDAQPAPGPAFNGLSVGRAPFFDLVYTSGAALGVAAFVFWNLGCQLGPTSFEISPRTPGVWRVIQSHAVVRAASAEADPCA